MTTTRSPVLPPGDVGGTGSVIAGWGSASAPYRSFRSASPFCPQARPLYLRVWLVAQTLAPSHAQSDADASQAPIAGAAVRRLLPAALLAPVLLGALLYAGEEAGWFGPAVGYAV